MYFILQLQKWNSMLVHHGSSSETLFKRRFIGGTDGSPRLVVTLINFKTKILQSWTPLTKLSGSTYEILLDKNVFSSNLLKCYKLTVNKVGWLFRKKRFCTLCKFSADFCFHRNMDGSFQFIYEFGSQG